MGRPRPAANGVTLRGLTVSASESKHEFGYTLLNKTTQGWNLELKNPADETLVTCSIEGDRVLFPPVVSSN